MTRRHTTRAAAAAREAVRKAPVAASVKLTPLETFEVELAGRDAELTSILPEHIDIGRFIAAAKIWVRDNPDLAIRVDRASLHRAITQAAEDGLMPDGREGVINVYWTKVKDANGKEIWIDAAKWIPMVHGIRKRAMELQQIVIDAQVIHQRDKVVWRQGDNPTFDHFPAFPWEGDRGPMVAAYAIFRQVLPSGQIITLHREVMSQDQIEAVKAKSKNPDGMLWKGFPTEAWRKTVIRRGVKTVPSVHSDLMRTVARDDDDVDLSERKAAAAALPMPPPSTLALPEPPAAPAAAPAATEASLSEPPAATAPERNERDGPEMDLLRELLAAMRKATTMDALNRTWARFEKRIENDVSERCKQSAFKMYDTEEARIHNLTGAGA